jgi:hypothetical protein
MWYRVFGAIDAVVDPAAFLERLQGQGLPVTGHFRGDEQGWFACELRLQADGTPVYVERYHTEADGLRDDLNSWAAWVETQEHDPNHRPLMQRLIGVRQLFTLRRPLDAADEVTLDKLCETACRHLAAATDGVYQADGQGFFAADGALLLHEY